MQENDIMKIAEEAGKIAESNEDIAALREVHERAVNYVPEEPLRAEVGSFPVDDTGKANFTVASDNEDESDVNLLEMIDDSYKERGEQQFSENIKKHMSGSMNMSDEDAAKVLDCILTFRKDPKANVYNMLPQSVKSVVSQIIVNNQLPVTERNNVAKMLIQEFISEAEQDNTFVDFEAALNRAMQIPSLTDLYSEHLAETVDKKLPAMADAIEETDPEKAKALRLIAERFDWSVSYDNIKEQYDNTTLIRKAARRDYDKWHKIAENLNFVIRESKFKMPDAVAVGSVLLRVLLGEDDTDITEADIEKFLVVMYKSLMTYKEGKVENMAYIYYTLKNISMLSYTNEQAKGSFSAELISNIKTMIYYIRARESEFNAINSRPEKKRNKRSQRVKNRK